MIERIEEVFALTEFRPEPDIEYEREQIIREFGVKAAEIYLKDRSRQINRLDAVISASYQERK